MKIGFLCSDIGVPLLGDQACSISVREFTEALVDLGHDVFILCQTLGHAKARTKVRIYHSQPRGLNALGWNSIEEEAGVRNKELVRNLRSVFYNVWLQSEGSSIIERERPDFLYERYSLFGWGGIELARQYGIPLVLEVDDLLAREHAGHKEVALTATASRMEGEIFRGADTVIATSNWVKDFVRSVGVDERDVHVVPNGVSANLFAARRDGETVRRRYNLENKRVIGFLGRFQPWDDVQGLIRAFSHLHTEDPNLRLLLVGDGGQRAFLEEAGRQLGLGAAMVFTGNIPHDAVPEYTAAMDVAVAPYAHKDDFCGLPLKVFEYMAAGTPTVAAAIEAIEEVIEHRETGWLYSCGDQQQLVEGLASLLYPTELSSAIGSAARTKILSDHTWQAKATTVTELANALVEPRFGVKTNLVQLR